MNLTKERAEEWVGFTSWKKLQFHGGKPWKIHATKHVLLIVGSWSACIRAATPPNTFQREQLLLRIPAIQRLQLDSKELIKFLKYSQGQVYNKLYVLVFVPQYQPHVGLRGFLTHPFGSTNCIHQAEFTMKDLPTTPSPWPWLPSWGHILASSSIHHKCHDLGRGCRRESFVCGFFKDEKKVCKPGKWRWCVYKIMIYNIQYIDSWWCI